MYHSNQWIMQLQKPCVGYIACSSSNFIPLKEIMQAILRSSTKVAPLKSDKLLASFCSNWTILRSMQARLVPFLSLVFKVHGNLLVRVLLLPVQSAEVSGAISPLTFALRWGEWKPRRTWLDATSPVPSLLYILEQHHLQNFESQYQVPRCMGFEKICLLVWSYF